MAVKLFLQPFQGTSAASPGQPSAHILVPLPTRQRMCFLAAIGFFPPQINAMVFFTVRRQLQWLIPIQMESAMALKTWSLCQQYHLHPGLLASIIIITLPDLSTRLDRNSGNSNKNWSMDLEDDTIQQIRLVDQSSRWDKTG